MTAHSQIRQSSVTKFSILFMMIQILPMHPANASPAEKSATTEVVDSTIQNIDKWWQQSKEITGQWWDSSRQNFDRAITAQTGNPEFPEVWRNLTPKLAEIEKLQTEHATLPPSALFGKDQASHQKSINSLLDEAVLILGISETNNIRNQIQSLKDSIITAKAKIAQYRQDKIGAPTQSHWKTTAAEYDLKIKEVDADIRRYEQEILELESSFTQSLERIGVRLSKEQLDLLMASVVGDDIVESSVIYANVRQMSAQLMTLTEESGEDLEVTRRYYGMYTVLLRVLLHMQQQFIDKIEQEYLPNIDRIASEVDTVRKNTEQLLKTASPERQAHLKANLGAQALTLKAAGLYREHLEAQKAKMFVAYTKTQSDLEVAQNTYQTVRLSGELVSLLRTSQDAFSLLLTIEVPELLIFDNTQMKQEFTLLTEKLER